MHKVHAEVVFDLKTAFTTMQYSTVSVYLKYVCNRK